MPMPMPVSVSVSGSCRPIVRISARAVLSWAAVTTVCVPVRVGTTARSFRGDGYDGIGILTALVGSSIDGGIGERGDVTLWGGPAVALFGGYRALLGYYMSLDRVSTREIFSAIRAGMRLFHTSNVCGLMSLEVWLNRQDDGIRLVIR